MLRKLEPGDSRLPLTLAMIALLLEKRSGGYYVTQAPQHVLKVESIMIHLPPEYTEQEVIRSIAEIVNHPDSALIPAGYIVYRMDIRLVHEDVVREVAASIGISAVPFPDDNHPALPERSRWDLLEIEDHPHAEEEDRRQTTLPL